MNEPNGSAGERASNNGRGGEAGSGGGLLLELAQRLLTYRHPMDPRGQTGGTQLLPGEIAPEVVGEIPIPDGARVVGSMVQPLNTTVILDTELSPEQVKTFYEEGMLAAGWTKPEPWPFHQEGGFQHNMMEEVMGMMFCRSPRGPSLSIGVGANPVANDQPATTEVRLTYDKDGRTSYCAQNRKERRFYGMMEQVIPSLVAPRGGLQLPRGGSSSGAYGSETSAHLRSDLGLSAVADHYRQQLAAGGWAEQSVGENGALVWSTYEFKDEDGDDWKGAFFVVEVPNKQGEYLLFVQAVMSGMEGMENYGGMVFTS